MKIVTKYVCEHCNREYRVKENAEHHENICWKNKANRSCLTCAFNGGIDNYEEIDGTSYGYRNIDYIVCNNDNCDGSDDMIPITNCEFWEEDKRTKTEKHKEYISKLVDCDIF